MKKICGILAFILLLGTGANADVKVFVSGDSVRIDTTGFPPRMAAAYDLMRQKCSRCHSIDRIVVSAQTGLCAITKAPFTKQTTRSVVTRMYLKPGANLTKKDARTVVLFLNYLLDQKVTVIERKE